jgi:hypothetical protein
MAEKQMKTFYVGELQLYYILCGGCAELLCFEEGSVVGEQVEIRSHGCPEVITATILNVEKTPYLETSEEDDSFCDSMMVDRITLGNVQCKISIKDPEGLLDKQSN